MTTLMPFPVAKHEAAILSPTLGRIQMEPPVPQEVIDQWNRQLESIIPRTDELSHLHIRWEPGKAWVVDGVWQAVERWMIWEMFPIHLIAASDPGLMEELDGVAPETLNHYDSVLQEVSMVTSITQPQWEMYRATGKQFFARPWWVIQGDAGGHQIWYSQVERKMRKLAGLAPDPALPGDLKYAPFDSRVMKHVEHFAKLRTLQQRVRNTRRSRADAIKAQRSGAEREWREAYVKWVETTIDMETAKTVSRIASSADADVRRVDTDYSREWEEGKDRFIETGFLH